MKNFNKRLVKKSKQIDRFLRFFLFPLSWSRAQPSSIKKNPTSILVFDFHLLGDIVMLTPMLVELRRRHPLAFIGLAAGPWAETLLENHPNLYDKLYILQVPWVKYDYGLISFLRLFRLFIHLHQRTWDWGIEIRGDLRQILLLRLIGARRRIGYDFTGGGWLLTDRVADDGRPKHIVDYHWQIVQHLHPEAKRFDFFPRLWLSPLERAAVSRHERCVGLHLGASLPLRMLSEEKALDLLLLILGQFSLPVLLFQSTEQGDLPHRLRSRLEPTLRDRVRIRSLSLREFIVEVAKCSLFVGMDSAGGHIAASLGIPVWSVFGPAQPGFCRPLGLDVTVWALPDEQVPCRPCDQRYCVHKSFHHCLENLCFK